MKRKLLLITLIFLFISGLFAQTRDFGKILLFQTNEVLNSRCNDIDELSDFLGEAQTIVSDFNKADELGDGFIFFAFRPVKKSAVWFYLPNADEKQLEQLKTKLLSITPCTVQGGPVAIAISNLEDPAQQLTFPKEWMAAVEESGNNGLEVSDLLNRIWPSEITKAEKTNLLKLIKKFKKEKDFSNESLQKYSDIVEYAVLSDIIKISIDSECWPEEVSNTEYGSMFMLAYICGNLEKQLNSGEYANAQEDGIKLELEKYKQLKKIDKNINISFFEDML